MSLPTELSPGPWSYDEHTKSVVDANHRPICGFFATDDDGRWVAGVRAQFEDLLRDAQKLISLNQQQEKRIQALEALVRLLKEDLEKARWWIDRYVDWRVK